MKRALDDEFEITGDNFLEELLLSKLCEPKPLSFVEEGDKQKLASLDDFAVMVAVNDEVEFLEGRVRGMAARLAADLDDNDELFKIDFSNGTIDDSIRYLSQMIPILQAKFAQRKTKK